MRFDSFVKQSILDCLISLLRLCQQRSWAKGPYVCLSKKSVCLIILCMEKDDIWIKMPMDILQAAVWGKLLSFEFEF